MVMDTVFTIIVLSFVVAVLSVVAYALFEMSPFGRHKEHFRNAAGERRVAPPNLEDGHY
jgi:Ca2+/H+ antiporter